MDTLFFPHLSLCRISAFNVGIHRIRKRVDIRVHIWMLTGCVSSEVHFSLRNSQHKLTLYVLCGYFDLWRMESQLWSSENMANLVGQTWARLLRLSIIDGDAVIANLNALRSVTILRQLTPRVLFVVLVHIFGFRIGQSR